MAVPTSSLPPPLTLSRLFGAGVGGGGADGAVGGVRTRDSSNMGSSYTVNSKTQEQE